MEPQSPNPHLPQPPPGYPSPPTPPVAPAPQLQAPVGAPNPVASDILALNPTLPRRMQQNAARCRYGAATSGSGSIIGILAFLLPAITISQSSCSGFQTTTIIAPTTLTGIQVLLSGGTVNFPGVASVDITSIFVSLLIFALISVASLVLHAKVLVEKSIPSQPLATVSVVLWSLNCFNIFIRLFGFSFSSLPGSNLTIMADIGVAVMFLTAILALTGSILLLNAVTTYNRLHRLLMPRTLAPPYPPPGSG
jgi:hypothetical protein